MPDIMGTADSEVLEGTFGDDQITALEGDDTIVATGGTDHIDGGSGIDTIDFSNFLRPIVVDIADADYRFNALGSGNLGTFENIENVIGTAQNDELIGNDSNNLLVGNGGVDLFHGSFGEDTLIGGEDLQGIVTYNRSPSEVNVNLNTGLNQGGHAEGDVLINIRVLRGSNHNDTLTGLSDIGTELNGGAGDDLLIGGDGDDRLNPGDGDDTIIGGAGDEVIFSFFGGLHADTGDGDDSILVLSDSHVIELDGGDGIDTLTVAAAEVDLEAGTVSTPFGDGTIENIENVSGSTTDDEGVILRGDSNANGLRGSSGDDLLDGRDGDDTLIATFGNDTVIGGAGDDALSAGLGSAGEFQFLSQHGHDTLFGANSFTHINFFEPLG